MYEENFKCRINILHQESGVSIKKFADMVGLSRQTMQFYLDGRRTPDSDSLAKICKALSVSSDWLLCLSDVRTPSQDIKSAVAALGISEKAAQKIVDVYGDNKEALSRLLEEEIFGYALNDFARFLSVLDTFSENTEFWYNSPFAYKLEKDGSLNITAFEASSLIAGRMANHITRLCDDVKLQRMREITNQIERGIKEASDNEKA